MKFSQTAAYQGGKTICVQEKKHRELGKELFRISVIDYQLEQAWKADVIFMKGKNS